MSLLTRPEPRRRLDQFYALLDTPVGMEKTLKDQGFDIVYEGGEVEAPAEPPAVEKPRQRLIMAGPFRKGWRLNFTNFSDDIIGFLAAWGFVAFVIIITIALTWIGK